MAHARSISRGVYKCPPSPSSSPYTSPLTIVAACGKISDGYVRCFRCGSSSGWQLCFWVIYLRVLAEPSRISVGDRSCASRAQLVSKAEEGHQSFTDLSLTQYARCLSGHLIKRVLITGVLEQASCSDSRPVHRGGPRAVDTSWDAIRSNDRCKELLSIQNWTERKGRAERRFSTTN